LRAPAEAILGVGPVEAAKLQMRAADLDARTSNKSDQTKSKQ
jgi:hypothetical protein